MARRISEKSFVAKAAGTVVAAVSLIALTASPASAQESNHTVFEQEIIITDDYEILEAGEGKDVESVEEYVRQAMREDGINTDGLGTFTPMAIGYGYLSNGTLRVDAIDCRVASVDYFKNYGNTITARFGVRQSGESDQWSSYMNVPPGGRAGATFRIRSYFTYGGPPISGLMQVTGSSTTYTTERVSCM